MLAIYAPAGSMCKDCTSQVSRELERDLNNGIELTAILVIHDGGVGQTSDLNWVL